MRVVVQRVKDASVKVEGAITGSIDSGLLVYLGVAREDTVKETEWMAEKIVNLRIFEDAQGKMNLSLLDISAAEQRTAGVLTVSQFTLLADARKGRRPYYGEAADPDKAKALYEHFVDKIKEQGIASETGVFQAHMDVRYTNDGPVTIILDSNQG
ncbi:MAG: D-tyrosyl-tRNA(Tyr) deacylase [Treponema sp.]|nr:D-tyrosyl-tRNA(Tyr) deacylase [Treponema sp.]